MTVNSKTLLPIVLGAALYAAPMHAQSADEVNDIIRSLAPIAGQTAPEDPSRALTQTAPTTTAPQTPREVLVEVIIKERTILIDPTYAMDFEVYFAFDSAALTRQARGDLRALGRALESPELRPYRYVVAGHTDAVGNADYNRNLSGRRALAARQYLIENFAIAPDRLIAAGFGEDRLKDPENPRAGINRRVEVVMIAQ